MEEHSYIQNNAAAAASALEMELQNNLDIQLNPAADFNNSHYPAAPDIQLNPAADFNNSHYPAAPPSSLLPNSSITFNPALRQPATLITVHGRFEILLSGSSLTIYLAGGGQVTVVPLEEEEPAAAAVQGGGQ